VIKATAAPTVSVLGNRLVAHRLAGTVDDVPKTDEKTFITTVIITAKPWDARTLAASKLEAAATPVVAPTTDAEKPVEKPAEEEKDAGEGDK